MVFFTLESENFVECWFITS